MHEFADPSGLMTGLIRQRLLDCLELALLPETYLKGRPQIPAGACVLAAFRCLRTQVRSAPVLAKTAAVTGLCGRVVEISGSRTSQGQIHARFRMSGQNRRKARRFPNKPLADELAVAVSAMVGVAELPPDYEGACR